MIIYGTSTRERVVGGGEFVCPCCKFQRIYSEIESRRWFALYFIPLFPVYYLGRRIQCHSCGHSFGLEVIQIASPFHNQPGEVPPAAIAHQPISPHVAPQGIMQSGKTTHYTYEPPRTSGLGIASMVLGILSPFFFLACGASIFTSIAAVICGHLSLRTKAHESGRAPARGAAITGLALGYLFLLLSPIWAFIWYQALTNPDNGNQLAARGDAVGGVDQKGKDLLHDMEMKVMGASNGAAHGNSEEAKKLAQEFSDALLRLRDENFTGGNDKGMKLTRGMFLVCCELNPGSCAFVVHVPEFRSFTKDAKEGLADLAWMSAQETAAKHIGPQGELAVGLKGVMFYGAVMTGTCDSEPLNRDVGEIAEKDPLIAFLTKMKKAEEGAIAVNATAPLNASNTPAAGVAPPITSQAPPATAAPGTAPPLGVPPANAPPAAPPAYVSTPPSTIGGTGLPGGGALEVPKDSGASRRPSPPPKREREYVPSGLPAPKIEILEPIVLTEGYGAPERISFSPDAKYLAGQLGSDIAVFDVKNRKQKAAGQWTVELFGVGALLFSKDSEEVFVGGGSGAVQLWKLGSRGSFQPVAPMNKQASGITVLKARKDTSFVVGGGAGGDLFWQQIKGTKPGAIRQVQGLETNVKDIYLPESGLDFWAVDSHRLVQVDMKSAEVKSKLELEGVYSFSVKFSEDGKYLATVFGSDLHILDSGTGRILYRHRSPESLSDKVEWIPGQRRLLAGIRGGVAIFDPEKGYISRFTVGSERSLIQSITPSRDGSLIAITTLGDKIIHLVSIEKPTEPPSQ